MKRIVVLLLALMLHHSFPRGVSERRADRLSRYHRSGDPIRDDCSGSVKGD